MRISKISLAAALGMLLSIAPVNAQGTVGQITSVQVEKGLIEIDGLYYRISPEALNAAQGRFSSLAELKSGQVVNYESAGNTIRSLKVLPQFQEVPH